MKPRTAQTRIAESWPRHRHKARMQRIARVKKQRVRYRPERNPVKPWWQSAANYKKRSTQ